MTDKDKTVGGRTREEQAAWLARNMAEGER